MREVLVLCTLLKEDYWEKDGLAIYPHEKIESVRHLESEAPILGIGVYIKDFTSQPPCFLMVKSVKEDEKGIPQFDVQFVRRMEGITSTDFLKKIRGSREMFFALPEDKVLNALQDLDVTPPPQWGVPAIKGIAESWQSWIGERFLNILKTVSNDSYEDRIAEIFTALGFEVEQKGHKKEGEYPDGVCFSDDFAIVYDCKNRDHYYLDTKDKRAMTSYVQDARRGISERRRIERVYIALVAHSFDQNLSNLGYIERDGSTKGMLLESEKLLYLLYKRLYLGQSFLLTDFEKLVSSQIITKEFTDKIYGGRTR